jgi:hypothetical protein
MKVDIQGPGNITFWWKVSSEPGADFLRFIVNGTQIASISGQVNWERKAISIPAGMQTARWVYAKNGANALNSDCGWVDQVGFTPTVTVTATDALTSEPGRSEGRGVFTFSRSGPTDKALTVHFSTSGTAQSGTDYVALGTNISFAPGSAKATKELIVLNDSLAELDETVKLTLQAGSDYLLGEVATTTAEVDIRDDESSLPPSISRQPQGGTFLDGASVCLRVRADGAGPFTYQWYRNGSAVQSATNTVLTMQPFTTAEAGAYYVVVRNVHGMAQSDAVTLTRTTMLPPDLTRYQSSIRQTGGLISYYPFDLGTANDAVGDNHGTLDGSTDFGAGLGGSADQALLLGGHGSVTFGERGALDFSYAEGTFIAWLRADWDEPPSWNPCLLSVRDQAATHYSLHLRYNKEIVDMFNGYEVIPYPIASAGNQWHHFAAVFSFGKLTIYWDGQPISSQWGNFYAPYTLPVQLGASSPFNTEGWIGAIDEPAFYGRALSGECIQSIYASYAGPEINTQPRGGNILLGSPWELEVRCSDPNATYQWFKDGVALEAETRPRLTLKTVTAANSGTYVVRVWNSVTYCNSTEAVLNVLLPDIAAYHSTILNENSLISYYPFDNGTTEDVRGPHHGLPQQTIAYTKGIGNGADKALLLNGGGFVSFGRVNDFDLPGTIELWVRADWPAGIDYNPCVLADREGPEANYSLHLAAAKDELFNWNGSVPLSVTVPSADSAWHHLAVTFSGQLWSAYWDGEFAGSRSQQPGSHPEAATILGSSSLLGSEFWVGACDELAFYQTILSPEAIRSHYLALVGPRLRAILNGNALQISWSAAYSDWILEFSDGLPGSKWTSVPVPRGNSVTGALPSAGSGFFRLRKP